jgi:predicted methyltransferase
MGSVFVTKQKAFGYLWYISIPQEDCYHKIKVTIKNPFSIFDCCTGCGKDNVYEGIVMVKEGLSDLFTFSQPSM